MWELPPPVREALDRLNRAGFEAYAVGGCVRDLLRGVSPHDWDIATSALPQETQRVFDTQRVIETGLPHGTLTVLLDGLSLEITTFREDGTYSDGRHPDRVTFTRSLAGDLGRRDFTVNAMAYHPQTGLVDPFGGQQDLQRRVIRCVGDPAARFSEDALRLLRALRFASTLEFAIEPATADALSRLRHHLAVVSVERVAAELTRLLCGKGVQEVLLRYPQVICTALPELAPTVGFDQRNPHHLYDVYTHTAHAVGAVAPDPVLRWTMLLHDSGKPMRFTVDEQGVGHFKGHQAVSEAIAYDLLKRLRLDNATIERVCTLIRWHDVQLEDSDACVKRWLNRLGPDGFAQLLQVKAADNAAQNPDDLPSRLEALRALRERADRILAERACFSQKDLAVNGDDLQSLGIPAGPRLGLLLRELLELVIDGRCENEKKALLQAAQTLYREL